jgi:hypothetical protein
MKWIGKRISVVDQKDALSFVIYPENIGWKIYILAAWLLLWISIGVYVTSQLFGGYNQSEKIALAIFMAFWFYFFVRVGRTFLYLTLGREFIKMDKTVLRLKTGIKTYGKTNQFFLENIAKLRKVELKENSYQSVFENSVWVRGTNKIEFEYMGKVYSFGRKLNDKDTQLLFNYIAKRISQHIKKKG